MGTDASSIPPKASSRQHTPMELEVLKNFEDIQNHYLNELKIFALLLSKRYTEDRKYLIDYDKANVEEYVDTITKKIKETFFEFKYMIVGIETKYDESVDIFRKSYSQHCADKKAKNDGSDNICRMPIIKPASDEMQKENKLDDDETAPRATDVENASTMLNISDLQTDLTDDISTNVEMLKTVENSNILFDEKDSCFKNVDVTTECDTKIMGPESDDEENLVFEMSAPVYTSVSDVDLKMVYDNEANTTASLEESAMGIATDSVEEPMKNGVVAETIDSENPTNRVASYTYTADEIAENTVEAEIIDSEGPTKRVASNSVDEPLENSVEVEAIDSVKFTKKVASDSTDEPMENLVKAGVIPEQLLPDLNDELSAEDERQKNENDNLKKELFNSDSGSTTMYSPGMSDVSDTIGKEQTQKTKRLKSVKERNKRVKQVIDDDDSDKEIERLGNISSLNKNMSSARNNNQEIDGSKDDIEIKNDGTPSMDHSVVEQDTTSEKNNNASVLEFLPDTDDVEKEKSDDSFSTSRNELTQKNINVLEIADRINKQSLLDSNSDENGDTSEGEKDSDIEIIHEVTPKLKETPKKKKKDSRKRKLSDSSSDESKKQQNEKNKWRNNKDLISTSDEERSLHRQKNSDEKKTDSGIDSSDSDIFPSNRKSVKRSHNVSTSSSDSDVIVGRGKPKYTFLTSSDEVTSKKPKFKKNRKRRRIIEVNDDSDENNEQVSSHNAPSGKGRKNIRKVLNEEDLTELTKETLKQEQERKKRIKKREELFNEFYHLPESTNEKVSKLVLDFDPTTKDEFISVNTNLVQKLKPHQVQGIKFMWDNCFESLEEMKKEECGGGCILAHCMGLGKSLQVITLVHTLMTHEATKIKTTLIICPLGTVFNWVAEFKRWLNDVDGGCDIEVHHIRKGQRNSERSDILAQWHKDGGVFIIGYEMFRNLTTSKNICNETKGTFIRTLIDPGADLVICDEGHMLKNRKSIISESCTQIKTKRRIVLTGTPLQNNLIEYHCMVNFVKPNLLGDLKEYQNRFVNPITNGQYENSTAQDVQIMKRRAHVLHNMLDGVVQRFDYNVLTPFLPPKQEYVISVTLTDLQAKLYESYLERSEKSRIKNWGKTFFRDFQILRLIWAHPLVMKLSDDRKDKAKASEKKEMEESDSEGSLKDFVVDDIDETSPSTSPRLDGKMDNDAKNDRRRKHLVDELPEHIRTNRWWREFVTDEDLKTLEHSSKLVLLFAILKACRQYGDKVLVFSQSIPSLDMIEYFLQNQANTCTESDDDLDTSFELSGDKKDCMGTWEQGVDYFRLDGQTPAELRRKFTNSFNNKANTRARLFLISTKAGGQGINLVAANRVVIFDASWNPSNDVQSIFRIYRFGQKKPCYIYRFVAQGTMEEKIYGKQVTKQSISCRVVDEHQIDRHFTASQLNELYSFERQMPSEDEIPKLPKDPLMAELLKKYRSRILTYHDHDSLLENLSEEELTAEERKQAWEDYENEKSGRALFLAQQRKTDAAHSGSMVETSSPKPVSPNVSNSPAMSEAYSSDMTPTWRYYAVNISNTPVKSPQVSSPNMTRTDSPNTPLSSGLRTNFSATSNSPLASKEFSPTASPKDPLNTPSTWRFRSVNANVNLESAINQSISKSWLIKRRKIGNEVQLTFKFCIRRKTLEKRLKSYVGSLQFYCVPDDPDIHNNAYRKLYF